METADKLAGENKGNWHRLASVHKQTKGRRLRKKWSTDICHLLPPLITSLTLKSEPKNIPHAQPSEITGRYFFPLDDGGWGKWDYFAFVTTPEQIDVYLFCQFKNANCKSMNQLSTLCLKY